MAARTRKPFDGACRKCGERGHKAHECRTVSIESEEPRVKEKPTRSRHKPRHRTESSRVEEKGRKGERATTRARGHKAAAMTAVVSLATSVSSPEPHMASQEAHDETSDAANPNATCTRPTRPEDESHNPPKRLPSMPLEGRRTGASNKLSEVPNDETMISQSTWMPRDESLCGEVHGVARSHKEAAGVDVKDGEASKRTRTGNDEERRAHERIDNGETKMVGQQVDNEATDTPNPHAKCAGPTRPVGTSHDPADKLSGEREGGGVAESEPEAVSMPIEGRSGRMPTDRADEAKPLGDGPSSVVKVRGAKVQGGGYGGGRGSSDSTTNNASDESRRLALKALAEDGVCQCQEQLANESKDSPEPPEPPDNPMQRRTQSPSVELEEERRAASSCDVEHTRTQTDALGTPGRDQDNRKRPMKLRTTSEHVNESSKRKGRKCTPGGT